MKDTYIITGEYGAGKTEFSINLALTLREQSSKSIYIADLDAINPYFRSREKEAILKEKDITLTGYSAPSNSDQDMPAISYGFIQSMRKGEKIAIIDLAGSENGLKPLTPLYDSLEAPEFLCVFNLYRPQTTTKEDILKFLNKVNTISQWPVTGLVNNSHMLHDTEASHILKGQEILLQVSQEANLPLVFTQLQRKLYEQISKEIQSEDVILFDRLQMREDWQ